MSALIRFAIHLFLAVTSVGLGLSILAHILSFLPFWLPPYQTFYLIPLGIFVLFLPIMFVTFTYPEGRRVRFLSSWSYARTTRKQIYVAMRRHTPGWARKLEIAIYFYAMITFAVMLVFFTDATETNSLLGLRLLSVFCMTFYYSCWLIFYSKARQMALADEKPHTDLQNPGWN